MVADLGSFIDMVLFSALLLRLLPAQQPRRKFRKSADPTTWTTCGRLRVLHRPSVSLLLHDIELACSQWLGTLTPTG